MGSGSFLRSYEEWNQQKWFFTLTNCELKSGGQLLELILRLINNKFFHSQEQSNKSKSLK